MRRHPLVARPLASLLLAILGVLLGSTVAGLGARAGDPVVAEPPKPPTTPLPAFENPTHDCTVGETLRYAVRDLEGRWTRWFEERVLAKAKKADGSDWALLETVETDATGEKVFSIDTDNTGWRPTPEKFILPSTCKWLVEKQKEGVLYIGEPATKAVRVTHRFLEEPKSPSAPAMGTRVRQIWYSHDVPATGRVKMFPAQQGGERMAISWDRRLSADECTERSKRLPPLEADSGPKAAAAGAGMEDEPGMAEPGMAEPGMEEPGMEPEPAPAPDEGMKG